MEGEQDIIKGLLNQYFDKKETSEDRAVTIKEGIHPFRRSFAFILGQQGLIKPGVPFTVEFPEQQPAVTMRELNSHPSCENSKQ